MMTQSQMNAVLAESRWLQRLALNLAGPERADDVVQETLLATLNHPPPDERPLRPWLARVARNVVRMEYRGRKRRDHREEKYASESGKASHDDAEVLQRFSAHRMLADHLAALPEPYRSALLSRYFDEKSSFEIAEELDLPSSTVRWRLKRGLELLKARLEDHQGPQWRRALVPILPVPGIAAPSTPLPMLTKLATMKVFKLAPLLLILISSILAGAWFWTTEPLSASPEPKPASPVNLVAATPASSPPAIPTPKQSPRSRLLSTLQQAHPVTIPALLPQASSESSSESGSTLTLAYLMHQVEDFKPLLQECYENCRATDSELEGKLAMQLTIIGDKEGGLVETVDILAEESTLYSEDLEQCVTETLYALELAPPDGGGRSQYTLAMHFTSKPPRANTHTKKQAHLRRQSNSEDDSPPVNEQPSIEKVPPPGECDQVLCLVHPEQEPLCCAALDRRSQELLQTKRSETHAH